MLEGFTGGIILALIDFFMVFVVLSGLAGTVWLLHKFVVSLEGQAVSPAPESAPAVAPPVSSERDEVKAHIAAILAALCEFTSLTPGSFKIDQMVPLDTVLEVLQPAQALLPKAHIAAIAIAIHEYTSLPMSSLRITGIKPLGRPNAWKMAGRLELMGIDTDS
jgi:Na+-transporting methylmalonyl-CoA/oxaloacetate decarboxylase gamma subunit